MRWAPLVAATAIMKPDLLCSSIHGRSSASQVRPDRILSGLSCPVVCQVIS